MNTSHSKCLIRLTHVHVSGDLIALETEQGDGQELSHTEQLM